VCGEHRPRLADERIRIPALLAERLGEQLLERHAHGSEGGEDEISLRRKVVDDHAIADGEAVGDKHPRRVVERFMAAMEKLDYDTALTYVSDTIVYTNIPMGPVEGPDAVRGLLEPFFASTLENQWVISNVAVHGPTVFIERLDRHHYPAGWAELPVVGVLEVQDGLITAWRDYFDLATLQHNLAQVGQSLG
jgi:limonene-1,2-epoxide hydrolase